MSAAPLEFVPPRLPPGVRALNALERLPGARAYVESRLTFESLVQQVRRLGSDAYEDRLPREGIAVLLQETHDDPDLTLFGQLTVRKLLVDILANRNRIAAELAAHPETHAVAIRRPVFIAGLPRTGTTLLQRLLAQDPQFRSLLCWEALAPAPAPRPETRATDHRIRQAACTLRSLYRLLPSLRSMHAMSAIDPEECEWLLANALTLPGFAFECPEFPQFNAWCRQQNQEPAYRYYRTQLQILQRNFPEQRWLLKGNEHVASLDALLAVFPDAVVIQTHRDPAEALPSTLSFYLQLMGLKYRLSESRVRTAIKDLTDDLLRAVEHAATVRAAREERQFGDVAYPDLIADPVAVLRRLYARFDWEWTPVAERRVQQWLAANPQGRHGAHRYSLAQFGLTCADLHARFSGVLERLERARFTIAASPSAVAAKADGPLTTPLGFVTLEQALAASDDATFRWFGRHVNPRLAGLLRLGHLDRRFVRASGAYLYDRRGREYLDLTSGCGALPFGHNPPEVLDAVRAAQRLPSILLMGYPSLAGAVGKSLAALLPGDLSVVTLGSGGAEAVEIALITAVLATGRTAIVASENCYHGHTLATLVLSKQGGPALDNVGQKWDLRSTPLGDIDALEHQLRDRSVAAFLIEPILGEGGAILPPNGYLRAAAKLCRCYGTLLIFDEIQTGFGRTGQMFALAHDGATPDIITVGKAFGSGVLPVSAAVTSPAVWKRAYGDGHRFQLAINTFGGNAAACATALKTMEILVRDGLIEHVAEVGDHARRQLESLRERRPIIRAVRGRGLLLGLELDPAVAVDRYAGLVISRLLERHGVLMSFYERDRRILRFEPPLTITVAEIDRAVAALDEALGQSLPGLLAGHAGSLARRTWTQ